MKPHLISLLSLLIYASFFLCSNCQQKSETQILLEIKSTWGNPPALVSWNSTSGDHCNRWNGIYCTNGFVSEISLINQNLNQSIPDSICRLNNLSHLDLSDNELPATFPEFLYNCSSLQYLNISMNYFVGVLPTDIDKSLPSSLTYLDLSQNNFTGDIPASIGSLVGLKELHLEGNLFNGTYPREIANLINLEHFSLAWNGLLKPAQIPAEFGNLVRLKFLWMRQTNTIGEIPNTLSNLTELEYLDLGSNQINGTVPSWIWSLEKLQILYMFSNHLTGDISFTGPSNLIGLSSLQELSLDSNEIHGSIPQSIQVLKSLTMLNLSSNKLIGSIPDSIGSLSVLTTLDLSNNELSGPIPVNISNLKLVSLNLSVNNLSGRIPHSLENQVFNHSFLSNPGLCSDSNFSFNLNLPGCSITTSILNKLSRKLITIFATLVFVVLIGIGVVGILLLRAQIKRKMARFDEIETAWKLTSFHKFDFTEDQITQGLKEENIIGSGGSSKLYKINLNNDEDQIVAVKRIFVGHVKMDSNLEKNFNAEVRILSKIRHANIVKLHCCISSTDSKLLVYEYMENSSLDRWLYSKERMDGTRSLDWPTRLGIAIDSAKGLCYMHHSYSQPIMHRDIKSSNILLDMKFKAKVADFGLARVLKKSGELETVSAIQGSFGYIPPECGRKRKINEKVDVYSFGVILLELTTGKRANEGSTEYEALADWAWQLYAEHGMLVDMIDEDIRNDDEYLPDMAAVLKLGLDCTSKDPIARPTMKWVVQCLSKFDRTVNTTHNGFGYDQYEEAN